MDVKEQKSSELISAFQRISRATRIDDVLAYHYYCCDRTPRRGPRRAGNEWGKPSFQSTVTLRITGTFFAGIFIIDVRPPSMRARRCYHYSNDQVLASTVYSVV